MSVATLVEAQSFRTARELLEAAGLSWSVELVPAFAEGRAIPRARAVVRSDRREPIAVVGLRYAPVQNADAFAFLDGLVGAGRAVYETAGMSGGGRRVWVQARLPGDVWVTREDNVGKYLTLVNSHDGGGSLRAFFTPRRIVCSNTLRAALREGARAGVSIRHVGDVWGGPGRRSACWGFPSSTSTTSRRCRGPWWGRRSGGRPWSGTSRRWCP